jgi:hypothetical protein
VLTFRLKLSQLGILRRRHIAHHDGRFGKSQRLSPPGANAGFDGI